METDNGFDLVLRNDYKIDQEKVLDQIKVFNISEIKNQKYKKIIEENEDFYGLKVYKEPDLVDDKIIFRKGKNNVGILQTMESRKGMSEIYNSIIVDFENKKCFSVDDLTTILGDENRLGVASIFNTNYFLTTSSYSPEKSRSLVNGDYINEGGSVVWNENEAQRKLIDLRFGNGAGNVVSFLSLFHELGHRYQIGFDSEGKKFSTALKIVREVSKNENLEQFVGDKEKISESERNAWAFSLMVAKNLKGKGLDIMRGFDTKKVNKIVDLALLSYDRELRNVPGKKISNRERAKERKK